MSSTLGAVQPTALTDARLQLHHAAQLVAAVGATLLPPRPDDSHPNLGWSEPLSALVGHAVEAGGAVRAALRPADLTLLLADDADAVLDANPLRGQTLDAGLAWLAEALTRARCEAGARSRHPRATTSPHTPWRRARRWTRTRPRSPSSRAGSTPHRGPLPASPPPSRPHRRCAAGPHHFDLATLLTLETDADGSATRTIGVGLSPGDESYDEPYWYVSPWPYPDAARLPALAQAGRWHTEGYVAAILTGSEIVAAGRAEEQSMLVDRFLDAAIEASRDSLA